MRILLILISLFFTAPCYADVTNVSGLVIDGESLTITGTNFGSAAPNVITFDDFETGTPGATISTGAGSAKYGQWDDAVNSAYYGTNDFVSGSQSYTSNYAASYLNYIQADFPAGTRDVFISWWLFIPVGYNIPGEGTAENTNWKQMWLQGESTNDDDLVLPTRLGSWVINGNESDPGYHNYTTIDFVKGEWKRLWIWLKGSTTSASADGEVKLWELVDTGVVQRENDLVANNLKETGAFEKIRPNGYGRITPSCITSFDDIYVASGPNAQARVEIGNASTYMASTDLTILTATSWSDTQVVATVNLGRFSPGETAYLYVFDADGTPNATGYEITIGGGGTFSPSFSGSGFTIQ